MPEIVKDFGKSVPYANLPKFYCLDIGKTEARLGIVEVSSINFAGVYDSDCTKIVEALSNV